jgi:mannose-6-phosphate isomerase
MPGGRLAATHEGEAALRRFAAAPRPVRVTGAVQEYAWGGSEYLAELTGCPPDPSRPRAELWLGAHPAAPATAWPNGVGVPLDRLVAAAPAAILGERSVVRFGPALPYLLKVLDVRTMLSIQAHPTLAQAREGFARENAAGIPLDARHRNYRDANHKPEAHVALSEFWLLCGFRRPDEIVALLAPRPGLAGLLAGAPPVDALPPSAWLERLYTHVMRLDQPAVDRALAPWLAAIAPRLAEGTLDRRDPDYWAARAAVDFARPDGHLDRGVASIYLLNLVRVPPGAGLALSAGVLHAYLAGQAVEIMASSDNVLRGGLTPKHVDVDELLRILRFEPMEVEPGAGTLDAGGVREYPSSAGEFVLRSVTLAPGGTLTRTADSCETLLVTAGVAEVAAAAGTERLGRGECLVVPTGLHYTLTALEAAVVFVAAVGPENGRDSR